MRIVDLTFPIRPHFRWKVEPTLRNSHARGDVFQSTVLTVACHAYTHVDAPVHFLPGDRDIASMPVDQWIGPAAVVDLTHLGDNGEVSAAELDRHAGHVQAGDIVLLRTDWPKKVDVATEKFWKDAPYTGAERVRLAGGSPGEGGRLRLPAGLHGAHGHLLARHEGPARGARDPLRVLSGRHHGHRVPDQPRRRSACRAAASWRCRSGSKAPTALRSGPSPSWSDAPTPPTDNSRHGPDRSPAGPHGRRDQRAVPARLPRSGRRAA